LRLNTIKDQNKSNKKIIDYYTQKNHSLLTTRKFGRKSNIKGLPVRGHHELNHFIDGIIACYSDAF